MHDDEIHQGVNGQQRGEVREPVHLLVEKIISGTFLIEREIEIPIPEFSGSAHRDWVGEGVLSQHELIKAREDGRGTIVCESR